MAENLDPADFAAAAASAVAACADVDGATARGAQLADTGLLGLTAPETVDGLGLPLRFAVPLLEAAGSGLLGYPLIEAMLLAQALSKDAPDIAKAICSGRTLATIAWIGTIQDGTVGHAPAGSEAEHILVFDGDGGAALLPSCTVSAQDDGGLDIEVRSATLELAANARGVKISPDTVTGLRSAEKILRAAFLTGAAERCLQLAVDYANIRVQFGSPLSAFQALRHRLSRDRLALETMRNGVLRAVRREPIDKMASDAAWLGAAAAGPKIAESAIQIHGGMGFTWEVPLHRHLRQIRNVVAHGDAEAGLAALSTRLLSGTTNDWYRALPVHTV